MSCCFFLNTQYKRTNGSTKVTNSWHFGVQQQLWCHFSPYENSSGPCVPEQHPACARWFHSYPQWASRWTPPQTCGSETGRTHQRHRVGTSRHLRIRKCTTTTSKQFGLPPPKKLILMTFCLHAWVDPFQYIWTVSHLQHESSFACAGKLINASLTQRGVCKSICMPCANLRTSVMGISTLKKNLHKHNTNNIILRASSCRDLTHFLMHELVVEECRMCLSGHSTEHYKTINSPGRSEGCRRLWRRCLEAGQCCPHRGPNRKQTKIRTRMFQLCSLESKIAEALNMR